MNKNLKNSRSTYTDIYRRIPDFIKAIKAEDIVYHADIIKNDHPEVKYVKIDLYNDTYSVYNYLHDSWINFKLDDMIRIDLAKEGDVYPIDSSKFEELYEPYDSEVH